MLPEGDSSDDDSILIFLPDEVVKTKRAFLHGEIESFNKTRTVYVTETHVENCEDCLGVYLPEANGGKICDTNIPSDWTHFEGIINPLKVVLKLKNGLERTNSPVVLIFYDRRTFINAENSLLYKRNALNTKNHFRTLIEALSSQKKEKKPKTKTHFAQLINIFSSIILFLSLTIKKLLCITKFSAVGCHIDNYLNGLIWLCESKNDSRAHIKRMNYLLSLLFDLLLGAIIIKLLTTQSSLDKMTIYLSSAETLIQRLRDLINWLTGDPAGFKLNQTFSKMLASFFLFYIDIWCAFIDILKPAYDIIFFVFVVFGKMGITFQVSIISDLLYVMTFHIYCICTFAARLYNLQISALIALWRLFLGRKKNPLRGRVDSCKYTPEQLFIGTLGFTVLLFLLPTTLIYYIVFTFPRILLLIVKGTLQRIRYFVHSLQVYSLLLWLIGSPKVCTEIHLISNNPPEMGNFLVFHAKLVCASLRKTVQEDLPDFFKQPEKFKLVHFLYSLLTGYTK